MKREVIECDACGLEIDNDKDLSYMTTIDYTVLTEIDDFPTTKHFHSDCLDMEDVMKLVDGNDDEEVCPHYPKDDDCDCDCPSELCYKKEYTPVRYPVKNDIEPTISLLDELSKTLEEKKASEAEQSFYNTFSQLLIEGLKKRGFKVVKSVPNEL